MDDNVETIILDYADWHPVFSIEDLSALVCEKGGIKKSSLSWHLFKLLRTNRLFRVGRGKYAKTAKPLFVPVVSETAEAVCRIVETHFPFARLCVYDGETVGALCHHLASNRMVYVETGREEAETVFHFLKTQREHVYLSPDKEFVYNYVDMDKGGIFVKPLVSEAPLQKLNGLLVPTLEKLLVDILRDEDFFYLQGGESLSVYENAFGLYVINRDKLLRYARRRKMQEEVLSMLKKIGEL